jgi:uncharacterized protein YggE
MDEMALNPFYLGAAHMAEAQVIAPPLLSGTRLDVSARGEVKRVPDVAVISAGVVTQSTNAAKAMQENAARMARVLAALREAGVATKDIATASVSLSPQYRYNENQPPAITGYQASNQLTVRFRDVGKSGAILDALVREGANQINGPTLVVDNPEAALDEARVAAIKAARARADLYASATGMHVKRIVSISEAEGYSPQPVPMMARGMVADAAMAKSEILPGEQSLAVGVSVVFELQ